MCLGVCQEHEDGVCAGAAGGGCAAAGWADGDGAGRVGTKVCPVLASGSGFVRV